MNFSQEEIDRIELRSDEVQEILSRPPKWIVRWGITIIFFVTIVVIIGSSIFKYPDIVSASVVLTTENPPAKIQSKVTGKIENLFVSDNQLVEKNTVLGIIENPAKYSDVKEVEEYIGLIQRDSEIKNISSELKLGTISQAYLSLEKNIKELHRIRDLNYYGQKKELYHRELKKYGLYLQNMENQKRLLSEEVSLTRRQFLRDSVLNDQKLLSEADFEKSRSQLISKMYNYEQIEVSITGIELQIETLNQNILELDLQERMQLDNQWMLIQESKDMVQTAIDNWYYQFVLISPTNGKVTFNQFWNENQTVTAGENVMTIIPEYEGEIIGKVQLDYNGAGKVKVGQQANLQFANYPYMEFGMVQGKIRTISLAPENNFYTAEIELVNGLNTFYNIELDFKQEMKGVAEIITEDLTLLHRIAKPFKYVLKKNRSYINE